VGGGLWGALMGTVLWLINGDIHSIWVTALALAVAGAVAGVEEATRGEMLVVAVVVALALAGVVGLAVAGGVTAVVAGAVARTGAVMYILIIFTIIPIERTPIWGIVLAFSFGVSIIAVFYDGLWIAKVDRNIKTTKKNTFLLPTIQIQPWAARSIRLSR